MDHRVYFIPILQGGKVTVDNIKLSFQYNIYILSVALRNSWNKTLFVVLLLYNKRLWDIGILLLLIP